MLIVLSDKNNTHVVMTKKYHEIARITSKRLDLTIKSFIAMCVKNNPDFQQTQKQLKE